jgi:hypothetical protein
MIWNTLMSKCNHDWLLRSRLPYRDEYKNKYILEIYVCECGAGHMEKKPLEAYELWVNK